VAPAELYVDPAQIQRSGAQISSAARQLHGQVSSFQQDLAGYGQPWGHDMVGSLIGGCYLAISGAAMESFADNTSALDDQGTRVQAMASTYRQAEDVNTADVNHVRGLLG
jgi:hypothetical protein